MQVLVRFGFTCLNLYFKNHLSKNKIVKLNNLQKTMILSSLIFVVYHLTTLPVFGQEIDLTGIQTNPSHVHVGDSFQINATIINDSPGIIYFNGGCQSPLSVIFDKNVAIGHAMDCFAIFKTDLKPGENAMIVGPSQDNSYTANLSGITNADVIFSYQTKNKSENTISKSFTFDIFKRTSIPEFPSISVLIFTIATMSSIAVMVSRKDHDLFKL